MNSAALGLILAIAIGVASVKLTTDNAWTYLNLLGLLIVVGGTLSVAAIGYNIRELGKMFVKISHVFRNKPVKAKDVVVQLIQISKASSKGQKPTTKMATGAGLHPFIVDGIRYIENGFSEAEVEDIMTQAVVERKEEYQRQIDVVSTIAKYPPAFGMIGTVIGLVALLYGLGDQGASSRIGPNMAIALITTLYGLVCSNYLLQPVADNLIDRMKREMHARRIIIRGILMLHRNDDPVLVHEMLNTFLMPAQRLPAEMASTYSDSRAEPQRRAA